MKKGATRASARGRHAHHRGRERSVPRPHEKGIPVYRVPLPPRRTAQSSTPSTPDFILRYPRSPGLPDALPALLRSIGRHALGPSLALSLGACAASTQHTDGQGSGGTGSGGGSGTGATIATGGTGTGGMDAGDTAMPLPCGPEGWDPLHNLLSDADYVAVQHWAIPDGMGAPINPDGGLPAPRLSTWFARGTACEDLDPGVQAGCEETLATPPDSIDFVAPCDAPPGECYGYYIATTQGALVQRYTSLQGLLGALGGSIDSPEEAVLVALMHGIRPDNPEFDVCHSDVIRAVENGYILTSVNAATCSNYIIVYEYLVTTQGQVSLVSEKQVEGGGVCIGRLTDGVVAGAPDAQAGPGRYFAAVSALEGAAVVAFERLAHELSHHGAPQALVDAALDAAAEEVTHATLMAGLARRYGATPAPVHADPLPVRDLLTLAIENAAEGCVRETLGAAIGHYQAGAAADPEVAAVMALVAEDECGHAALSHRIAAWLHTRLSEGDRAAVAAAQLQAIDSMLATAPVAHDAATLRVAGLPDAGVLRDIGQALQGTLWGATDHTPHAQVVR